MKVETISNCENHRLIIISDIYLETGVHKFFFRFVCACECLCSEKLLGGDLGMEEPLPM